MKKILVVRYRFIGDMILTIPFLRNLRYHNPDAQIDMLVAPNSGEVIEDCPYVNNFIYYDTKKQKKFLDYVKQLKAEKYDKAYILKRSFASAVLCFLAGIKERIGFNTECRGIFLTKRIKYDMLRHESLCFLDVLKADGLEIKDYYLENWVKEENTKKVQELFKQNNILPKTKKVVVNVTATNQAKVWNINNFARIIEYLSNEKNVQVIYIGAKNDKEKYKKIPFKTKLNISPVNLCGEVTLKDSLALLKQVDFIVGNDSGNIHMASSVGTKVICLYGPMPYEKWKALGDGHILLKADIPCMPCYLKKPCPRNKECLNLITVDDVKKAIDKLI